MIKSFLIDQVSDGTRYLMYDTLFERKHFITACGLGRVEGNGVTLAEDAQATLCALCDYAEYFDRESQSIRFQEIANVAVAPARVLKALKAADDESLVFFVCRTPEVYDATIRALRVQWLVSDTKQ